MEEIFPFLAGLAYMAYRIYANFKKGQEEARNRNPSQPRHQEERETYIEWLDPEETYVPEPVTSRKEPATRQEPVREKYQEPKYEPSYREPVVQKRKIESLKREVGTKIPQTVKLYNPEVPAEEVVRGRAIHEPHKHKFVASQEEEQTYIDFDFKDAVIKEAILNRPQY